MRNPCCVGVHAKAHLTLQAVDPSAHSANRMSSFWLHVRLHLYFPKRSKGCYTSELKKRSSENLTRSKDEPPGGSSSCVTVRCACVNEQAYLPGHCLFRECFRLQGRVFQSLQLK